MASLTKVTKVRRKLRKLKAGKLRKNANNKHGSTQPSLVLDKPNANELKQTKK